MKTRKTVRKYLLPKEKINFSANSPWELLGDIKKLDAKYLFEPTMTMEYSNETLQQFVNGEIEIEFPTVKIHNVDIERTVKNVTEASSLARTHDDQQAVYLFTQERRAEIPTDFKKSHFNMKGKK